MLRRLPPLNALKAFDAAARSESFTRAAEELSVTPGAVNHQIKALEVTLGVKLFTRERRRVFLTDAGRDYLAVVRDALDRIAVGTERLVHRQNSGVLRSVHHRILPQNGSCIGSAGLQRAIPGSTSGSSQQRIMSTLHARMLILRSVTAMAIGRGLMLCVSAPSGFFRFAVPSLSPTVASLRKRRIYCNFRCSASGTARPGRGDLKRPASLILLLTVRF